MAEYIEKAAVLAEIDRRIIDAPINYIGHQRVWAYNDVKDILTTLKVKEVDLDREMQAFAKLYLEPLKICDANVGISITMHQLYLCAKYFFELGLNASNHMAEENLESFVRQVIDLDIEAGEHYNNIIKEERKENGGSDLMINLLSGTIDAKELGIQYVLDKLKAQKGE
jgi:hypothetical protein